MNNIKFERASVARLQQAERCSFFLYYYADAHKIAHIMLPEFIPYSLRFATFCRTERGHLGPLEESSAF
jgi:hypothetical protein